MNRRILPMILALLTIGVIGRVGVTLYDITPNEVAVSIEYNPVKPVGEAAVVVEQHLHDVLGQDWIPSAEAAASMPIAEESSSDANDMSDLNHLRQAREEIKQREKDLEERVLAVKDGEDRAVKRIAQLEELEARIQDLLQQENSINDKKIKRLTAVYEGMKAEKAAPVIAQMELSTVIKMFSRMNEKQVGKILSFLPPEQAVLISQALTERIPSNNK